MTDTQELQNSSIDIIPGLETEEGKNLNFKDENKSSISLDQIGKESGMDKTAQSYMVEPKNRTLNLKKTKKAKNNKLISSTDFEEAKVMNTEPCNMISIRDSNLDLESDRQQMERDFKSGSKQGQNTHKMFSQLETTINPSGMQTQQDFRPKQRKVSPENMRV